MSASAQRQHDRPSAVGAATGDAGSPYLASIRMPRRLMLKFAYGYTRRRFGQVPGPLSVFCPRMPAAFTRFYMKPGMLDRKLKLSAETAVLVRQLVASSNMCLFCMDANRWSAINRTRVDRTKLDALGEFRASALFSDRERVALAFAEELARDRLVKPETFSELAVHYSEREICEVVFLVSSEYLYNINNLGLNIGSAGMCETRRVDSATEHA